MDNLVSISSARANLPKLVKTVSSRLERYILTINNKPKAVILSLEEVEALEETAEILSEPNARKEILIGVKQAKKGLVIPLSKL